jgi:hypothetical protein
VDLVFADFRKSEFGDIIEDIMCFFAFFQAFAVFQFVDLSCVLSIQHQKIILESVDILQDIFELVIMQIFEKFFYLEFEISGNIQVIDLFHYRLAEYIFLGSCHHAKDIK